VRKRAALDSLKTLAATSLSNVKRRQPDWVQRLFRAALGVLRRFEVNRAVFFSVLTQGWSALAGPATMLVIAHWLTAVEQGFYYTFSSVLALQVFVELGLVAVIVQVASHEWAFLKKESGGRISGDPRALSRLASLLRFALKWYAVSGLLVIVGLSVGGFIFFSAKPHPEIAWHLPWFALCGIAGLALMMSPIFSVIEGCNQVASIYSFRFWQGVVTSIAAMASIILGAGLFTLPIVALSRFFFGISFVICKHRTFVKQLFTFEISEKIRWLAEVWPFQWRMGISAMSGYFIFSIMTPVMFYYHGAKVAGQMGMTWLLVSAIEALSLAWVSTRLPHFGILVARRQFAELDKIFMRTTLIALLVATVGSLCLWSGIFWIKSNDWEIGGRVLSMLPLTLLIIHRILNIPINTMAWYLRAHKREPMMLPSLIGGVLAGFSTWLLGAQYGPTGAAAGFLALGILFGLPVTAAVFISCKRAWHARLTGISSALTQEAEARQGTPSTIYNHASDRQTNTN
jgi:O-antigen/teichoic acid export membrane protein